MPQRVGFAVRVHLAVLLWAGMVVSGCGGKEPPAPGPGQVQSKARLPRGFEAWPRDKRDYWLGMPESSKEAWLRGERRRPLDEAQEAADRKELVRPAPSGFKPESEGRKLRLTLVPKDSSFKVGEKLWYRLELQNLGREPVRFQEQPSWVKSASSVEGKWKFYVLPPGASQWRSLPLGRLFQTLGYPPDKLTRIDIPGESLMSEEEKEGYVQDLLYKDALEGKLSVTLAPGETLVTRPWRFVRAAEYSERVRLGLDPWPMPEGDFRELWASFEFDKRGTYRVKAAYEDPPTPSLDDELVSAWREAGVSEKSIQESLAQLRSSSLGVIGSDPMVLEVSR